MDLKKVRKQIDQIDFEILKLLNRRMEMALTSSKFKDEVADPAREKEVLASVEGFAHGLVRPEFGRELFQRVIGESRRLQKEGLALVGFQGEHGANGEMAAMMFLPNGAYIPCPEFSDVFDGVAAGYLDYGLVPVENSLGGVVSRVNELMVDSPFHVVGEVMLPVHHCLLALKDTDYRDIKVVRSHPQALAQCRGFLKRHKLEARPFYDTAGAARMLFQNRPEGNAVIAGELCARLYHLEIIKENIEDHTDNVTRFQVIAREPCREAGDKCSIVFSTEHRAGALFDVMKAFADHELNLTRVESVPLGGTPGNYVFFLDFEGSDQDEVVQQALDEVRPNTTMFRFLGCYNSVAAAAASGDGADK
ncbi:MAG: bifunctional chorismate mutase/prephenate dehydratase [Deltaproteobacteria bacterium]|nr:bifunctional chorismate mutase/prephenate dehydratase [Deltaproteobacteria bacterium]